jgi:hypothetical protein
VVVAAAIHHDLAQHGADPVLLRRPERGVERGLEHGAVHHGRRRPGGGEGTEREWGEPLGRGVVERPLQREDVPLQPCQQVEAGPDARVRQLRQVDVEVDHARQQDERAEVDGRTPSGGRASSVHASTAAMRPAGSTSSRPSARNASARRQRREHPGAEHVRRAIGEGGHRRRSYRAAAADRPRTMPGWTPCSTG